MMDESDWIERALQGDAAAFGNLVERYQARLVAFLWNLLGSGDDARDAAQDAFIQAYARLRQFDRSRGFKSWLFTIAYNRGIDLLRRRRSFRLFWLGQAMAGELAATVPAEIERSPFWRPVLRRLTPQERAVLALKYNEGCCTGEIAAALGCSDSTVRVHLLNARRKLRKELREAGFIPAAGKPASAEEVP